MGVITIPKPLRERLGEDGTEAFVLVLQKLEDEIKDDLARKSDIKELELKIEIAKNNTIKWVAGLLLAQSAILIGGFFSIIKYLLK